MRLKRRSYGAGNILGEGLLTLDMSEFMVIVIEISITFCTLSMSAIDKVLFKLIMLSK